MPSYYLGLDVHKRTTSYCLTDPTGKIIAEASLPTAQVTSIVPDHDCAVVLEATGTWHHTYDSLSGCCASVTLAHPAAIRAIASARIKTDRIDARILAHLLRADLIPRSWAPPPEVRELRDLVRLRWRFVSQRTQAKTASPTCSPAGGLPLRPPTSSGRRAAAGSRTSSSIATRAC